MATCCQYRLQWSAVESTLGLAIVDFAAAVEEGRRIFVIQLLAFFIFLSPILVSAYLVLVRGRNVRGRWLFLLVGPLIVYTVLWLALLLFMVPAWFVLTWFTPAVLELTQSKPFWYPVFSWVAQYDGYIASVVTLGLSVWLVQHFWPRWPAVLAALTQQAPESSPSEPPQPSAASEA